MRSTFFSIIISFLLVSELLFADVIRDGTIGVTALVQPVGPDFEIPESLGELRGANLFHSFREFNLTQGQSATFSGTSPINNVISRISGGSTSNIDGLLRSTIPGANLYFMNPYGIVFGPNAQLDIQGAFHASTGGELRFSDGKLFNADMASPILSLGSPETFGFIGKTAAPIELNGSILASSGGISLSAGSVLLNDAASIFTATQDLAAGGDLVIEAIERVVLSGTVSDGWGASLITGTFAEGHSGELRIEAPIIELRDGARLATTTLGAGNGGALIVNATERLSLLGIDEDGWGSSLQAGTFGAGASGELRVEAPVIELEDGARMVTSTAGEGNGGALFVVAEKQLSLSGVSGFGRPSTLQAGTFTAADSGALYVEAAVIDLQDGAVIETSTTGPGNGGLLTVAAKERLLLSGFSSDGGYAALRAGTRGEGEGGDIEITAPFIFLENEASIESLSIGTGNAGLIKIIADDQLHLTGDSAISSEAEQASGGDISIEVGRLVNLLDSKITTNVGSGEGQGGNIHMVPGLMVLRGSQITAQADAGSGGNIHITADNLWVSADSIIDASAAPAGIDGHVLVTAIESDISDELERPDTTFLATSKLLLSSCDSRAKGRTGSLGVAHARGLPMSPESLLLAFNNTASVPAISLEDEVSMPTSQVSLRGLVLQQQTEGYYSDSLVSLNNAMSGSSEQLSQHIATNLGSAANAYLALGDTDTALDYFNHAIQRTLANDHAILATLYNNLGNLHMVRYEYAEASAAYSESTQQARLLKDLIQEAKALANGARAALADGQYAPVVALAQQARIVTQALAATHEKAYILIHLAKTMQYLSQVQPINKGRYLSAAYNDLRIAVTLSKNLADYRTLSYAQGNLGSLYQSQNRTEEALYLTRFALHAAEQANAPESLYRWYWQAGQILWAQNEYEAALQAYRRAVAILEESRFETLAQYNATNVHFRQMVAPVYLDLVDALLQRSAQVDDSIVLLLEARATVEQLKAAELRDYFRDDCVTELEAKAARLETVSPSAAIIYPIILPQRLELLVNLPSGLQRYPVAVDAVTLQQTISRFRSLVEHVGSTQQLQAVGIQLYNWLVRPYLDDLNHADVDTLVFVPDGSLRTAPLAALHDGHNYLIHRYSVVVTPGLSLTDPQPLDRGSLRLLLAGVSDAVQDYPALPHVPLELERIQQLFGGQLLLNEDFTQRRIEQALDAQVNVLHIASHAKFTGVTDDSYLLTYDSRLSMSQLEGLLKVTRFRDQPLELLVLSACQTAVSDDRAAMGLVGIGLKAGARSAVGSLWFISDEGTTELMSNFYRRLKNPELTKAQALQQAQLSMLAVPRFSHPFFWSSFLLMNNWL